MRFFSLPDLNELEETKWTHFFVWYMTLDTLTMIFPPTLTTARSHYKTNLCWAGMCNGFGREGQFHPADEGIREKTRFCSSLRAWKNMSLRTCWEKHCSFENKKNPNKSQRASEVLLFGSRLDVKVFCCWRTEQQLPQGAAGCWSVTETAGATETTRNTSNVSTH